MSFFSDRYAIVCCRTQMKVNALKKAGLSYFSLKNFLFWLESRHFYYLSLNTKYSDPPNWFHRHPVFLKFIKSMLKHKRLNNRKFCFIKIFKRLSLTMKQFSVNRTCCNLWAMILALCFDYWWILQMARICEANAN